MFDEVDQAGIGRVLTPKSPLSFSLNQALPPASAPLLGQDTDSVLQEILGLSRLETDALRNKGILATTT